ncbi:hypothetical protein MMC31_002377 [Peltigera leucophlebia]|nr:hypothetical protein [Peltigera leucophlebia]
MPDKPFTVITYAASASLAAVALIYFFNPNQFIDGNSSTSSARKRKKGIVGLSNPANDCFINSILQSLSGLGYLRLYLIRELHRRELDGPAIYAAVPEIDVNGKAVDVRKLTSLQSGEVTRGLKDIIDSLNERPICKKTISAGAFIRVLERAFGTRISKSQQDAQELLQVVAERLAEEYHAGRQARKRARQSSSTQKVKVETASPRLSDIQEKDRESTAPNRELDEPSPPGPPEEESNEHVAADEEEFEEEGFPLEGRTEAQTECQHCHFKPRAKPTSFVMLNLMVPQKSSTTLNECFDAHFKREYIDDYKCDKCRLHHALESSTVSLARAKSTERRVLIQKSIDKLKKALEEDPETLPEGIELPDISLAPKRRIARHVQITSFPKVLIIHLSRSIFDPHSRSMKNTSKVSFPERLPVGGILNRRHYKLLSIVSHRGTHNSGHYESFRRQHVYPPYSTPHVLNSPWPYSISDRPSPKRLSTSIPPEDSLRSPKNQNPCQDDLLSTTTTSPTRSLSSISSSMTPSTRPSSSSMSPTPLPKSLQPAVSTSTVTSPPPPTSSSNKNPPSSSSSKVETYRPTSSLSLSSKPALSSTAAIAPSKHSRFQRRSRKSQADDRWWRISDEKIKECKTAELLAMQKDVYMLFYEMEREDLSEGQLQSAVMGPSLPP